MKRLDRYILSEMVWPFVGGLATFVVLITGHMLFLAIEVIVEHHVPLGGVLRYIAYQVPGAAVMSLPVASLLASALALNRLAADHELPAVRTAGVSMARLMAPATAMGLIATAATLWLHADLAPRAQQAADQLLRNIVLQQRSLSFQPQRFIDTGRGVHFYAETVDNRHDALGSVYAFVVRDDAPPLLYWAADARFGATSLTARHPRAYLLTSSGQLSTMEAGQLEVNLSQIRPSARYPSRQMQAETFSELWRRIADSTPNGAPPNRQALLELHCRVAMAGACLVFALLSGPVALRFGRGQSLVGVLVTILVVFIYYVIMVWLRMLGNAGYLPLAVAAHGQNAVLAAVALLGIWRQR
ncbi:MAG: YjgP/YjgQ family permease [Armatimonadetes bacterium]|nr:YjgP/YjgQ family permease [Armatimonadota bacterium]